MFEFRWLKKLDGTKVLQYRNLKHVNSERLGPTTYGYMEWSEWRTVQEVVEK